MTHDEFERAQRRIYNNVSITESIPLEVAKTMLHAMNFIIACDRQRDVAAQMAMAMMLQSLSEALGIPEEKAARALNRTMRLYEEWQPKR